MSVIRHLSSVLHSPPSGFRPLASAIGLASLAWLWFVLINDLRVEWTVNPQYSYGWAVPFLCAFLFWQRIKNDRRQNPEARGSASVLRPPPSALLYLLLALCALLYFPTRLVEEANPGWRLVSWALALEVIGITLCAVRIAEVGRRKSEVSPPSSALRPPPSAFVFPLCFFLVAVPWPTLIEQPLIQGLTRLDTAMTTELLGWLGIPAIPHGNVIEVATGMVGIDEACSGIRSFQATLMISLFLGEFYGLSAGRRALCVFGGFAMSVLFNLVRMSLLVWVAARKGIDAIASWHDPAGVTILVACFLCLWALAARSAKRRSPSSVLRPPSSAFRPPPSALCFALAAWLLLTEFSIEGWYHWHEARVPRAAQWTVAWPTNNPTFKSAPLTPRARQILRYDEGRGAAWTDGNLSWQAVFLHWKPGRTAIHLAQNHTPDVCMTAAGYTLKSIAPQEWFDVDGLRMPFSVNEVTDTERPFYVFYCLWDDRAGVQGFQTMGLTYGNRLAPVLAGLRNPGQRSLEIAVIGPASAAEAENALRDELKKLIRR